MAELAPQLSPYRYGFNNPVNVTDPDGNFEYTDGYGTYSSFAATGAVEFSGAYSLDDELKTSSEPPINLFRKKDSKIFHEVVKNFKYNTGDNKFYIFGHGNPREIITEDEKGEKLKLTNATEFNEYLSSFNPIWKQAMKNKEKITLCLFSCNSASNEFIDLDGKLKITNPTIAEQISTQFPNITVIAADGYIGYGYTENRPSMKYVLNHSGDGGFKILRNGKTLSKNIVKK
jgi:hypothetical protein